MWAHSSRKRTGCSFISRIKNDAFSDLRHTQNIAIIIIAIGALAIIATAVVLSIKMVNRISVTDREKEIMNQQVIETGKLASIGELASGIAHEINNPVAIMVEEAGWIEDLLAEEDLSQCKKPRGISASPQPDPHAGETLQGDYP